MLLTLLQRERPSLTSFVSNHKTLLRKEFFLRLIELANSEVSAVEKDRWERSVYKVID